MRLRLGAIVACLAVLASGVAWTAVAGAQSAQKTQPITIKVGEIVPIDSSAISFKAAALAAKAAVEGFNKRQSHVEFELVQCDSHGDPNQEAACARQLVSEGVVATIADIAAINPSAVNSIISAAGIPRVSLTMLGIDEFSSPVSYPTNSGPILGTAPLAEVLADKDIEKVSFVRVDLPSTAAMPGLLRPTFTKLGIEIVNDVAIPPSATDFSQFVSAASANGAEAAVMALLPAQLVPLLSSATQLNSELLWSTASSAFSTEDVVNAKNENVLYMGPLVFPSKASAKNFPGMKVFLKDMKAAKEPDLAPNKLTQATVVPWLGLQAITEVTKDMQSVDAASLRKAFDEATDIDMAGIIPPWTPSTPGPTPLFSRISNPYWYQWTFTGDQIVTKKQDPIDLTTVFVAG